MYFRKNRWYNVWLFLISFIGFHHNLHAQDFSKGNWIKVYVPKEGLQVLTYDWFRNNKLPPTEISIQKIAIYQYTNDLTDSLDHKIDTLATRSLTRTPIFPVGFEDQQFDPTDKIFFPVKSNPTIYSDSTFCLINLEAESSLLAIPKESNVQGSTQNFYYQQIDIAEEKYNFLQSGQLWVSEPIYTGEKKSFTFPCKDALPTENAILKSTLFASSIQESSIQVTSSNYSQNFTFEAISGDRYDRKAVSKAFTTRFNLPNTCITYPVEFQFSSKVGSANIGKNSFIYPRKLIATANNSWFIWPKEIQSKPAKNLLIEDALPETQSWIFHPLTSTFDLMKLQNGKFQMDPVYNSQLLLADSKLAFEPIFVQKIAPFNNNLNNQTKLLIISPKAYYHAASQLASYKNSTSLPTEVRYLEDILNEYAAGKLSLPAIKSFIYCQKKYKATPLSYVLLLSDASVDHKGNNSLNSLEKNTLRIPTYESQESLYPLASYASDDYLGILTDINGSWDNPLHPQNFTIDLSIGRLPAKSPSEADLLVNKIIQAQKTTKKNTNFTFVADDEDSNIHLLDSEDFNKLLKDKAPQIQRQKIYVDAFPMKITNGSYTSPAANQQIIKAFQQDAGFIHFMGHGSESGWTDEKIFTINDIVQLKNNNNLPMLLTATCQFAKFDNPFILSGAEALICSSTGGAQAVIGTSRPVFQSNNYLFGKNFYTLLGDNLQDKSFRLGDLVRQVKNKDANGIGNRNIILLGDPSSPLPWTMQTNSIMASTFLWGTENSIQILSKQPDPTSGMFQIYTGEETIQTLGTKSPPFNYQKAGKLIYQRNLNVSSPNFSFTVPSIKNPKTNNIQLRFSGVYKETLVHGFQLVDTKDSNIGLIDQSGPKISQNVENSTLFTIEDPSGIGILDAKGESSYIVLNDTLNIPLIASSLELSSEVTWKLMVDSHLLSPGTNRIAFHVSDLLQNTTDQTFTILNEQGKNQEFTFFPNPFQNEIHLKIETDSPWTTYRFQLNLYNSLGQSFKKFSGDVNNGNITFDVSDLPKQEKIFYLFEITDPNTRYVKRQSGKLLSIN